MNIEQFWDVMEKSRTESGGAQGKQEENLRQLLLSLEPEEILSFRNHFDQLRAVSYSWDLWGAAYLINGGCSDDGFDYFRSALIASGRERFEKAVSDPESLADWVEGEDFEFEGINYVAGQAYEEKTGESIYDHLIGTEQPSGPAGEEWSEEGDDLERRFPRLWAKFDA